MNSFKRFATPLAVLVLFSFVAFGNDSHAGRFSFGRPSEKRAVHSFGFDAVADSPGVEVTDYVYGTSSNPGTKMPDWVKRDIGKSGGTNTYGDMIVGESLYVQWRVVATGAVFEDTVDLKNRLPKDITDHTVYFVVTAEQLYVYLVTPEPLFPTDPIVGPLKFRMTKVVQIYPDLN